MIKHILIFDIDINDCNYYHSVIKIESDKELDDYINLIKKLKGDKSNIEIEFEDDYNFYEQLKNIYPNLTSEELTKLCNIIPYTDSIYYSIDTINYYAVSNTNKIL